MFDRSRAESAFQAYVSHYNAEDIKIALKIEHTYRVCENAERIAKSLCMEKRDVDLAWFLGLLHDIGRFEQVRRYHTFLDAQSVDHAALGADNLFNDGLIRSFPSDGLPEDWRFMAETAIRAHNRLQLPDVLDPRTRTFCQLLRDADKVDIFRVSTTIPFHQRVGDSRNDFDEEGAASPEVMACVREHRCVPRGVRRNVFEGHLSHCCMAFELIFPESRRMAVEQGYLIQMLRGADASGRPLWPDAAQAQLRALRRELEDAWAVVFS